MISDMTPCLIAGEFYFCNFELPPVGAVAAAFAIVREAEGTTCILDRLAKNEFAPNVQDPMARITLNVFSSLQGVGLTAAVATALADLGIACNVVAGFHHDHVFVPSNQAKEALFGLLALQAAAQEEEPTRRKYLIQVGAVRQ